VGNMNEFFREFQNSVSGMNNETMCYRADMDIHSESL
jgi:hypothetical protein